MTTALTIMRIQPLHNKHKYIIEKMLDESDVAYLLIGSANTLDERNPFSFELREKMVRSIFPQEVENKKLIILPINDINNPQKWVNYVLSKLPVKPDMYYCGSDQDAELFTSCDVNVKELAREEADISATKIRQQLKNKDNSWHLDVPAEVVNVIEGI